MAPEMQRAQVVICPRCGDAYLNVGGVTEAGKAFQARHGRTGSCPIPEVVLTPEQTLEAVQFLCNVDLQVAQ